MTARDGFGLGLRIVGLVVSLYGCDWLGRFVLGQLGYFKLERTDIGYYLLNGIAYLVVGAYFMKGAPHFLRYAYPDDEDPETEIAERDQEA